MYLHDVVHKEWGNFTVAILHFRNSPFLLLNVILNYVRFQVLMVASMKIRAF
jgi:hypothetical protein